MPSIGKRCHELRIPDRDYSWRIAYRLDPDEVTAACQARILRYERQSKASP